MDLVRFNIDYQVEKDQVDPETGRFDLTYLFANAIKTSNEHDRVYTEDLGYNYKIGTDPQAWVITQNHLEVYQPLKLGDNYNIQTQLETINRFFATRTFFVRVDGELVAKLGSQFALIGLEDRKIRQINTETFGNSEFLVGENKHSFSKIHPLKAPATEYTNKQEILAADIDGNEHVNNVVYLRWSGGQLPKVLADNYIPASIDIKYGHEILYGNDIEFKNQLSHSLEEIENAEVDEIISYQEILNQTYGKNSSTIRVVWTKG